MFQIYQDRTGQWRWAYVTTNNRKLADSGESYYNRADCEHAIAILKRDVPAAPVYSQ
jgi:uncharacterized protein YegP (UPF0339 family)